MIFTGILKIHWAPCVAKGLICKMFRWSERVVTAFWNRVYKVLGSAGCYWIHGYGPFAVAGLMVNVLSARPDQQVITGPLRKLGMAFYAIGVSGDSALRYETVVGQGRLLLIVQGGRDEVELASETIATTESVEMAVHAA